MSRPRLPHQQQRGRSDTRQLQRLIEVLKERGSDLGNSLEASAADLLADVRIATATAAVAAGDKSFENSTEASPASTHSSSPKLSRPLRPSRPPPPLPPEPEEEMLPGIRRRAGRNSDEKKKVHFEATSEAGASTSDQAGNMFVSHLVRKSSAVLMKTLTLNMAEKEAASAENKDNSLSPPSTVLPAGQPLPLLVDLTKSDCDDDKVASPAAPAEPDEDEASEASEEWEPESDSYKSCFKHVHAKSNNTDSQYFSQDDPPDPAELRKLPKPAKRYRSLALQWRRQRQRDRRAQVQPS